MSAPPRLAAVIAASVALLGGGASAALASAPARASLPALERELMCVTCKIPLNLAASPQADRERSFVESLIAAGRNEGQIKRALVAQYGRQVLALPSARGFDIVAYLVPAVALLALLAGLVALLRRWRQRGSAELAQQPPPATLSAADAARLDADIARFD